VKLLCIVETRRVLDLAEQHFSVSRKPLKLRCVPIQRLAMSLFLGKQARETPKPRQGAKPPASPLDPLYGESDIHAADAASTEEDGGAGKGTWLVADHIEAVDGIELFTVDGGWDGVVL
jgi:hypothetical protein